MQIFETVNWLFNKVMYSFDFINYNKLHKITCYIQQSRYFQVLCDFMEFSRVDEWKSDIQIHLKLYTEQSSGFEEAHYRQVRVSWWYQQRRWSKGRKASKFLRNYRNIQQMRKKKSKLYLSIQHADKKQWQSQDLHSIWNITEAIQYLHILWQKDSCTEGKSFTFY